MDAGRFEDPFFDQARLIHHIAQVRQLPGMDRSACVIAYENNYGRDVRWVLPGLQRHVRNFLMLDGHVAWGGSRGIGVHTTNDLKYGMTMGMLAMLHGRRVAALEHGVCSTPGRTWNESLDATAHQLDAWTQFALPPVGGRQRFRFDGKKDGNDDIAFCLMLANDAHRSFISFFTEFTEPGPHNRLDAVNEPY